MARYRVATLLPSETATTAGTKTIDLDVTDPVSMITVIMKAKSAGTVMTAHPAGNVSKIEVVDGSEVIASLSGYECQGLDFYNKRVMPNNYVTDIDDVYAWATFNLNFGRKLFDTDLALDPTKFRNLQLKITHNYRTCDASADDATLEVYAHMFDEKKISPIGYLRPVEVQSYASGANTSVETVDLPRDLPVRQMMLRGAASDYYPWQVVHDVKIEENGGAKIPFEMNITAWLKFINQHYPPCQEPCSIAVNSTARDVYAAPTFTVEVLLMPSTVTNIISRELTTTTIPFALDITASDNALGHFSGWCPHYCFPIPFGDQTDFNDWYDPRPLGSLKAKLTAGSAGTNGSVAVVLEQLKRY